MWLFAQSPVADAQTFQVTDEERAWLDAHPIIRLAPAPNFPPMEFFDEQGVYRGVMADYTKILEDRLGIKFEIANYETWQGVVTATKAREVDVWMEAQDTPERREYLSITEPYVHLPVVIIVRHDKKGVLQLSDLTGLKVAVIEGYASAKFVRDNHPGLELIPVPSVEVGLERVSFGGADALVANIGTASYYIERNGITNLRVAGTSGFDWHLCVAVRNDWPVLYGILQRALESIEVSQRQEIYRRWIAIEVDAGTEIPRAVWVGGAMLLVSLIVVLVFSRRASRSRQTTTTFSLRKTFIEAWPVYCTAAIAISLVVIGTLWSTAIVRDRARRDTGNAMRTVLNTTSQAVYDWLNVREDETRAWSQRTLIKGTCEALVGAAAGEGDFATLANTLAEELEPLLIAEGHEGFLLFDGEARVIAGNIKETPVGAVIPGMVGFVERVLESPRHTAARLPGRRADGTASPMLVGAGIETIHGPCVLALGLDPASDFSVILQRGRIGESGETYGFNQDGLLVTASRFDDELRQIGLIQAGEEGFLNVEIRNPGGNLLTGFTSDVPIEERPLTVMAQAAIAGHSGSNLFGYNDYRGVSVIGMWVWDAELGLGIATEMDVDEAYAFLRAYQRQIWTGTLLASVLIFGLTGLFLRNRIKMAYAASELAAAHEIVKLHKDRMQEELNIGREIQMSMVPLTFPAFPERDEFSVHATLQPAREVGGDFYDFFFIDDSRFCFCIGDVAGKGVPAALFMAVTQTLIKSRAGSDTSTASILTHVNNELSQSNKESMFVTVFIAILNITTGEVTYTNAGHNPPYVKRDGGELLRLGERHGPVLGAVEGLAYSEARVVMYPEDLFLLYTDGVTEAFSNNGELFSEKRLCDVLNSMQQNSAESLVDETVTAVHAFENGAEQADDITVLAVQFAGADKATEPARGTIRIEIENNLSELEVVIKQFREFAASNEVSQKLSQKVSTVLDEVLNNVVSYAFLDGARHLIEVTLTLTGTSLTVSIRDDGTPFNPLNKNTPRTDQSIDEREIGGMGIHLVQKLSDGIDYKRHSGANVLTMVFHLARATNT